MSGAGIALVSVRGADELVILECTLCGGRLMTRTDDPQPTTLDQLVDAIGDHLAVNHPTEYYGDRRTG